jgi:hypothetical protein
MLESVSETFEEATMRSDVDAEEMFMQLLERVESPLGHVWLDGVSVGNKLLALSFADMRYSHEHRRLPPSPFRHSC